MLQEDAYPADTISTKCISEKPPALFSLSTLGSIRHWLVAGPKESPYCGPPGPDHVLRKEALDKSLVIPPAAATLKGTGPFEKTWQFHDPGHNEFVEFSTVYQELTVLDYYAFTEIRSPEALEMTARLWVAGAADLWVNETHVTRFNVTRSRNPDSQIITFPLNTGLNRLCVRLQCLGLRDTRMLFGLFLEKPERIKVSMSGAERIARAVDWIDEIKASRGEALSSSLSAPFDARVLPVGGEPMSWPSDSSMISLEKAKPLALVVEVIIDGVCLQRQFELPINRSALERPPQDRHKAHLEYVAKAGIKGEGEARWNSRLLPFLARRLLGRSADQDTEVFAAAVNLVKSRRDCSDFVLASLLRLELLHLATPEESAAIRHTALTFRYWDDEPGNDAMCFRSENHTLLFQGCQFLAGQLYPQDIFENSGNSGARQVEIALPRILDWLKTIENRGFEEFNSGTYMPITIAAMLNVVDFSGDQELSSRMATQIDRIFRDLAQHVCDGVVVSPQGRIYRNVLYPEEAGTQILLAYATDAVSVNLSSPRSPDERTGDWVVFLASSPSYRPPKGLDSLVNESISRVYRHADVQIILEKTPSYLLTSLAVPSVPRKGEHPEEDLRPGGVGYQQHLWQASLGRGCHVFVNHPGGFFDGTKSRPGYWYGNGQLPRVRQQKNWLQAIHVVANGSKSEPEITESVWQWGSASSVRPFDFHPVQFTHAHWPSDAFDYERKSDNWVFGQKGQGLIGLWCSEPLVPHDDILTGRELRAYGPASAWLVICGDLEKEGSLDDFAMACKSREPVFDRTDFILSMKGEEPTKWWERPEPMPS